MPLYLSAHSLARMVRRVVGAGAEVHEERPLRRDLLGVGDHADGMVDQVLGEVIARPPRASVGLLDELLVLHQVGVPLVGLAAQEAVVALEAAAGRPVALGGGHVGLVLGDAVPLAEHVGVVAPLAQHLGDRGRLERDMPVRAREAGGRLGDAGHADRRVVASGQAAPPGSASRWPSCGTACSAGRCRPAASCSASRSVRRTAPAPRSRCRPTR